MNDERLMTPFASCSDQAENHIANALAPNGVVVTTLRTAFPHLLAIYAFGSRVHGTARADSDLDLAVLVAGYADPLHLWAQANALSEVLGCAVDVLDLRAASTVMQHQVLTGGRRLWARELEAGLFESYVLSEKLALDAARAGLLADIFKEGAVYGR
jgi:predicted nucleotidyltransferase